MGWSPDGSYAAYIANHTTANQTIGPLTIFNTADGSEVLTSEEEKVIAFFWSPDSRKIAYFVVVQRDLPEDAPPEAPTTELDVRVLDIETRESLSLQKFLPSEEFHEFLSMFDQQGQSLSIWSPNSERITISGYLENGPRTPGIFLIPIDGEGATRSLAPGYIGVWSWE
jgi:Tol biopolymer transport system component